MANKGYFIVFARHTIIRPSRKCFFVHEDGTMPFLFIQIQVIGSQFKSSIFFKVY